MNDYLRGPKPLATVEFKSPGRTITTHLGCVVKTLFYTAPNGLEVENVTLSTDRQHPAARRFSPFAPRNLPALTLGLPSS